MTRKIERGIERDFARLYHEIDDAMRQSDDIAIARDSIGRARLSLNRKQLIKLRGDVPRWRDRQIEAEASHRDCPFYQFN